MGEELGGGLILFIIFMVIVLLVSRE